MARGPLGAGWVLASGKPVLQTITDDDLRAIAKEFGVTLREEFLD